MKLIGLTGGIGSGKTTIAQAFSALSVPIYNSDIRSKWLTNTNKQIIDGLTKMFGSNIYIKGCLNKQLLASIIFTDNDKLTFVNQLIHPIVFDDFKHWAEEQEKNGAKYVINEAAVLIENNAYKKLNDIILVCAPKEIRIKRTMLRDNLSREQVENRINNQMSDEEKSRFATDIIITDDKHFITPQILDIHNRYNKA